MVRMCFVAVNVILSTRRHVVDLPDPSGTGDQYQARACCTDLSPTAQTEIFEDLISYESLGTLLPTAPRWLKMSGAKARQAFHTERKIELQISLQAGVWAS